MISSTIIFLWLVAATVAESNSDQDEADTVVESVSITVPAKPIKKIAPRYPRTGLRRRSQAWIQLAFCIDESGSPQNISVIDSVGRNVFAEAAINSVKEWTYEPALVNGEPSWQSRNQTFITFAIEGGNTGAGSKFAKRYEKIGSLVEQGDLQEADKLFWHVYETFDLSLYELSKLWEIRAKYEVRTGDMYSLDQALHRATAFKGKWIDKKSYVALLSLRVMVELNISQYGAAPATYQELVENAGEEAEHVLLLKGKIEKVQDIIDGDGVLKVSAKIKSDRACQSCGNRWTFTPVRNDFSLANIDGALDSILMRCDHKRFESDISELVAWHIPDTWGTCHVDLYGTPGTTFDVLMLPPT